MIKIKVNPENPEEDKIRIAGEIISRGGLVAFPTETVYGLGADALNEKAVRRLFAVKERPPDNPLIVHIADFDDIYKISEPNAIAEKLIDQFFPGPLTVLVKNKTVPKITTAGLPTVAIRMPDHKVALKLIEESETVISAPSANKSGKPSPTKAIHVEEDFRDEIDCIIDGGDTKIGIESTVVDTTVYPVEIIRVGAIPKEELEEYVEVKLADNSKNPAIKYTHYTPKAEVIVLVGNEFVEKAVDIARDLSLKGKKVGIAGMNIKLDEFVTFNLGRNLTDFARNIFDALRKLEKCCDVIIVQGVEERGIGYTIMDRLSKAGRVYRI